MREPLRISDQVLSEAVCAMCFRYLLTKQLSASHDGTLQRNATAQVETGAWAITPGICEAGHDSSWAQSRLL